LISTPPVGLNDLASETKKLGDSLLVPGVESLQCLIQEIHNSGMNTLNLLYGRGNVVFTEGEAARGVYILRTGRAIVSISSSGGRIVILRVARPCDLLGLNSTLRNCPYDTTAKAVEPCRVDFISRAELLTLIERSRKGVVQYLVLVKAYGNVAKLDCRGLEIII
jgi:hypothetical protein